MKEYEIQVGDCFFNQSALESNRSIVVLKAAEVKYPWIYFEIICGDEANRRICGHASDIFKRWIKIDEEDVPLKVLELS